MREAISNQKFKLDVFGIKTMHCPRCEYQMLSRIKRKSRHRFLAFMLLGSLNIKRYSCERCNWKGLKLDTDNYIKAGQLASGL